jgi:hypothetical protein
MMRDVVVALVVTGLVGLDVALFLLARGWRKR